MDEKMYPKFKYNPNVYKNGDVAFGERTCQCCDKFVEVYVENMYAEEEIECICMKCIYDGLAAERYDGSFVQDADKIDNKAATEELFCRTPGYHSWQGENWKACCNDYCEYVGSVGKKELEELQIEDEVTLEGEYTDRREQIMGCLEKDGNIRGSLFRCLHCRKYHLRIDAV